MVCSEYVRCSFDHYTSYSASPDSQAQVFYGFTEELKQHIPFLRKYVSQAESERAEKFHHSDDRETYLICHGLLRMIISELLGERPENIGFDSDSNNKPWLTGNKLFFNISHCKGAFALAIIKEFYVGIDIENINYNANIRSIANRFFSVQEKEFLVGPDDNISETFFLFWTRKEALLKAIGTGLTDKMNEIDVSGKDNVFFTNSFDERIPTTINNEHFIYTEKVKNCYISVALPQKASLIIREIKSKDLSQSCRSAFMNIMSYGM